MHVKQGCRLSMQSNLIRKTYKNLKWNFKGIILFEIIYKLLALFVIVPLNYFILHNYMQQAGILHITNTDIVKFALTLPGIMSIFCILVISFVAIFIEISVLTYMANKAHEQKSVGILEGCINCIKIIPRKMSIYQVMMVLMAGVIGPLTGLGLYNAMIKELVIPSFIKLSLFKSWQGKALFAIVMISLCMLLIKWILAFPIFVIEEITLKGAFKKSRQIYKKEKYKLIKLMITWGITLLVIKLFLLSIYVGVGIYSIMALAALPGIQTIFIILYLVVFVIGKTILSVIMLPLFITFLVEIYYASKEEEAVPRVFESIEHYKNNKYYKGVNYYKNTLTQVILTLFITLVGGMAVITLSDSKMRKTIDVTAHRGSSNKAPENSIASIEWAIKDQADYAEIDVMLTKDNEVVLFHDPTLKRINGSDQMIKDMTLEEVKQVDNGSYFDPKYSDQRIPTLKEVIELAKGKIKLNIELKPVGNGRELAKAVADIVNAYKVENQVVVSSLDYDAVQDFIMYSPLTKVGYILSLGFGDFTQLNVDFVAVEYDFLTKELVYGMSTLGKEIHVWTINDPTKVRDVARLGVDNIITDDVELIRDTLDDLKDTKDIDRLSWFLHSVFVLNRYLEV